MIPVTDTWAINRILEYYSWYFGTGTRLCTCDAVKYPKSLIDENGQGIMCPAHQWLDYRTTGINQLTDTGIIRKYPPEKTIERLEASEQKTFDGITSLHPEIGLYAKQNPLLSEADILFFLVQYPIKTGLVFASFMSKNLGIKEEHFGEHLPVLITSQSLIDMKYNKDYTIKQTVEDILIYSPVLIVIDSEDSRIPFDNLTEAIYSRQYGIALIFQRM